MAVKVGVVHVEKVNIARLDLLDRIPVSSVPRASVHRH